MYTQGPLLSALNELEAELKTSGISSCAIISLDSPTVSESIRRVYQELVAENFILHCSRNECDMLYLEGSPYRLEVNRMMQVTRIITTGGKLGLPEATIYRFTSKR